MKFGVEVVLAQAGYNCQGLIRIDVTVIMGSLHHDLWNGYYGRVWLICNLSWKVALDGISLERDLGFI